MVHTNVGQKLLKLNILSILKTVRSCYVMLLLGDATLFSIWFLNRLALSYTSSASIQIDHLTPSGQFDMSYPIVIRESWNHLNLLKSGSTMKKLGKIWGTTDQLHILHSILAQWWQLVASVVALDPLRREMCLVMYPQTATANKTAGNYGTFSSFFSACNPVVHQGNMTWVLNWWRHLVASSEALNPLHRTMYSVLYQRTREAVKTDWTEVHLFVVSNFTINLTLAY